MIMMTFVCPLTHLISQIPCGDDAGCLDFSIGLPSVGQDMGWYQQEAFELRFGGEFGGYCKLELVPQGCKLILPAEYLWLRRKHGFYEDSILLLSAKCCLRVFSPVPVPPTLA
jgi:hypothetical protein